MHCMGVTFEVVQGIVWVSPSKIPLPDMTNFHCRCATAGTQANIPKNKEKIISAQKLQ